MMTFNRMARALHALDRAPELARCAARFEHPVRMARAYLQLGPVEYPFELVYRGRWRMTVHSWEDLTTAWVVLLGNEYDVRADDRTIVDLGANFGAFCALCAADAPSARVLAVEPFPATYERLRRFVTANGLEDRVTTLRAALSERPGTVRFDADPATPDHSRRILEPEANDGATVPSVEVEALDLATLFERHGFDEIDLLKIDIEGAEHRLLLGASPATLARVRRIGLEYHENGHESMSRHLVAMGFRITRHLKAMGGFGIIEYARTRRGGERRAAADA